MWPDQFESRLLAWQQHRLHIQGLAAAERYAAVNDWWWQVPVRVRDINWDDPSNWPDPWRLLEGSALSDLGRALAMSYTIVMADPDSAQDVEMVFTGHDNLVLIKGGKYILNWAPGQLLNIRSHPIRTVKSLGGPAIKSKIGGL